MPNYLEDYSSIEPVCEDGERVTFTDAQPSSKRVPKDTDKQEIMAYLKEEKSCHNLSLEEAQALIRFTK